MENTLKITPPEGFEIDTEKSTFEQIVFKEKVKVKYPRSVREIERPCYTSDFGASIKCHFKNERTYSYDISKERAEGFLALIQLIELYTAWNEIDRRSIKIESNQNIVYAPIINLASYKISLPFISIHTRDNFEKQFKHLIEEVNKII